MTRTKLPLIIAVVLAFGLVAGIPLATRPDPCEQAQARYDERVTGKPVPVSVAASEMSRVLEACQP